MVVHREPAPGELPRLGRARDGEGVVVSDHDQRTRVCRTRCARHLFAPPLPGRYTRSAKGMAFDDLRDAISRQPGHMSRATNEELPMSRKANRTQVGQLQP